MSEAVILAEGLRVAFGERTALEGVGLAVGAGEIFGVVGADGAGKSTLLRVMIGQVRAAAGRVRVLGLAPEDPGLRGRIAYMPQGFGQYQDLSVRENLEFFAELHGVGQDAAQALIRDLLARTGLAGFEERRAGQLSGGMMQKLALACALVTRPEAMFLDEPTTGVDPVSRRAFWRLLESVQAEGVAILYATANMDEAERCTRVGFLERGRLAREGAPLDIVSRVSGVLLGVSGADVHLNWRALRELPAVQFAFRVGRQIKVWVADARGEESFRAAVAAAWPGLRVEKLLPTMQDVAVRELAAAPAGASNA
jgi:ABC-2 type transport system ATP-binding protein